jgi:hypothetical protein
VFFVSLFLQTQHLATPKRASQENFEQFINSLQFEQQLGTLNTMKHKKMKNFEAKHINKHKKK